ncbi:hypothetical protein IKJ53_03935 [bacterium]|nr:hypothetical protein [bacterium]
MNVSFNGIKNLYIGKKSGSSYGTYMTEDGNFKDGEKEHLNVLIRCDLTNDEQGNHLSEFQTVAEKVGLNTNLDYINSETPQKIELLVNHVEPKNDNEGLSFTTFKINGSEVPADRKTLPLYTYMAKFTREISDLDSSSKAQKAYADVVNNFVHDEAVYYIDNVM